jgi:ribosome biogenesis GTPase A
MNDTSPMATQLPRSQAAPPNPLAALLERADVAVVAVLGYESPLVDRIRTLRRRLENENLQLAVLGQFKRGKSTFINALLGADLLPKMPNHASGRFRRRARQAEHRRPASGVASVAMRPAIGPSLQKLKRASPPSGARLAFAPT